MKPEPLFKIGPADNSGLDRGWDVTADGERFLFVLSDSVAEGTEKAPELILIQNWAEELKRLVPYAYVNLFAVEGREHQAHSRTPIH